MKAQSEPSSPAGINNFGRLRKTSTEGKVRKSKRLPVEQNQATKSNPTSNIEGCNQIQNQEENLEIQIYLNKLQEMVPFMPKYKRLSKLEVITNVIDYIRDLREALGLSPCDEEDNAGFEFDMVSPILNSVEATESEVSSSPLTSLHLHPQNLARPPLSIITDKTVNLSSSSIPKISAESESVKRDL